MTLKSLSSVTPESEGEFSRRVCVSVYGRTIPEINDRISEALAVDPGYLELRLDYLHPVLKNLHAISSIKFRPTDIVTYRAYAEGGKSRVSTKTHERILLQIISRVAPPMIDVETRTLSYFPAVIDLLKSASRKCELVASSHNFQATENESELRHLVLDSARRYSPVIVKIVRWAREFKDNLTVLSLYDLADRIKPAKLVAFCAGPLGLFSRIACVSYGSPFTFASLSGRLTAPGQLDVRTTKALLDYWKRTH
jgi:3-dehydroquinate dehydratase I